MAMQLKFMGVNVKGDNTTGVIFVICSTFLKAMQSFPICMVLPRHSRRAEDQPEIL